MSKVKIPKPKVRELRELLKGIISASLSTRIEALAKAMQWYDKAIEYIVLKKFHDVAQLPKLLDKATKSRELGIRSNFPEEKENAFKQTIKIYQKVCEKIRPADVDKYFEKFKSMKGKLETEEENAARKFSNIIGLLEKLFPNCGLKFVIDPRMDGPKKFDVDLSQILYSKKTARDLWTVYRREGVMVLALRELPLIARSLATVPDGAGGYNRDFKLEVSKYKELHESIITFARSDEAPTRLVKDPGQVKQVQANTTNAGAKPKVHRAGFGGRRREGNEPYVKGSAMWMLWDRLKAGKELSKKDLFKGVPGTPEERLRWVIKHGPDKGWVVTVDGDKVRMDIKQ